MQAYSDMMAKTALDRDYGYATFNLGAWANATDTLGNTNGVRVGE